MKRFNAVFLLCVIWLVLLCLNIAAQTSAFTYQGRLNDTGTPTTGSYDFQFKLFDALTGGNQVGVVQLNGVSVTSGVFNVTLDFGAAAFPGAARFLDISVRLAGGTTFTPLTPRRPINSVPYGVKSLSADALSAACIGCVADAQIASVAGSKITGAIPVAGVPTGSGNYIQNTTSQQSSSNFNISGTGTAGVLKSNGQIISSYLSVDSTGTNNGVMSNTTGNGLRFGLPDFVSGESIASKRTAGGNQFGLDFYTSGENRLAITNNGNIGIGTTNPADKLQVKGDIRLGLDNTGCLKNNNGGIIIGTCSSDARLKREITPFPNLLDKLTRLQPVHFYWRAKEFPERHFGTRQSYGLIAQEVEQVLPELVTKDEEGYRAVNYSKLPLLLLQATKEQQQQIEQLKKQNTQLLEQNATLQKANAEIEARLGALEKLLQQAATVKKEQ